VRAGTSSAALSLWLRSDVLRAGSKNTPSLQRRILIGASIVLIAAFRLCLRITMVENSEVAGPIRADASEYYLIAYNLANEGVYTMSDARLKDPGAALRPDNFRWPGQPLLIAAFMGDWPEHMRIVHKTVCHATMWVSHWPLVVLAAAGSILVWLPPVVRLLPRAWGSSSAPRPAADLPRRCDHPLEQSRPLRGAGASRAVLRRDVTARPSGAPDRQLGRGPAFAARSQAILRVPCRYRHRHVADDPVNWLTILPVR
jgi:hypothetical protein